MDAHSIVGPTDLREVTLTPQLAWARFIILVPLTIIMVGAGYIYVDQPAARKWQDLVFVIGCGVFTLLMAVVLICRRQYLRVNRRGLTVCGVFLTANYRWDQIRGFAVGWNRYLTAVYVELEPGAPWTFNRWITNAFYGHDGRIPDEYGPTRPVLADFLNTCKAYYALEELRGHGAPPLRRRPGSSGAAMTASNESRITALLTGMKDHLLLSHVSWETYDALLDECADRRLRHTYDRGSLEFMTRSGEHEVYKSLLGLFLVTLADERNLPLFMGGELTLRRQDLDRGLEPDQCFWIANEPRVRGKTNLDLTRDPPPDLFIEVEVSRSVLDRLAIIAALGVPEVWRFDGTALHVGLLQPDGQYQWQTQSPTFPGIDLTQVPGFLRMAQTTDHVGVLRAFRAWVRGQTP